MGDTDNNIYVMFKPIIIKIFLEKYDDIMNKICNLRETDVNNSTQIVNMYNMVCNVDYSLVFEYIKNLKIELENYK